MFNLVKYELKGHVKELTIIISSVILLSLLLYTRINVWEQGAVFVCSVMISFAAMVLVFIWNIMLFSRDMYEESGYLLFTLPKKGYSILGGKLLTALCQVILVGIVVGLFNFITFTQTVPDWKNVISEITKVISYKFVAFSVLTSVFQYVSLLVLIYFSISLSKVAIKKKKLGKLSAFVIFVVSSLIIGKTADALTTVFPQTFSISMVSNTMQSVMNNAHEVIPVNISLLVFDIVLCVAIFIVTSYILEKKIDL